MDTVTAPFYLKAKISFSSVGKILLQPFHGSIALLGMFFTLGVLVWVSNFRLLFSAWSGSYLMFWGKVLFYLSGYEALLTNYTLWGAGMLLLFAVLTGINLAMVVYVVSASYHKALSSGTKNVGAIIAAIVGAGCAACGTSFLTPLVIGFSAAFGMTFLQITGVVANIVGIVLLLFSIYELGLVSSILLASKPS